MTIVPNVANAFDADIVLGVTDPVPDTLALTATSTSLEGAGSTSQLTVTATFPDSTTADVSTAASGTDYRVSNPAIATVSSSGLVTAVAPGTVLVSALNEGALGVIQLEIDSGAGDADGDGIPDGVELSFGLDPNDPADALLDLDNDGLTNLAEFNLGTTLDNPDTDGDTIQDGEETIPGMDGFITDPLLADTDGDGLNDALEIALGFNPTDAGSGGSPLSSIEVSPSLFVFHRQALKPSPTAPSTQLTVTGRLADGTTVDLTSPSTGTQITSSSPVSCQVDSGVAGRIEAGPAVSGGQCTITALSNGLLAFAHGVLDVFSPIQVGGVVIPGEGKNVDVGGDLAYVAAGSAGLLVVDVADPTRPTIETTIATAGNAEDVKLQGSVMYVAAGDAGLLTYDLVDPLNPAPLGSLDTAGHAQDLFLDGTTAFVADGTAGMQIIDVSTPATPTLAGTLDTAGDAQGVAVDSARDVAVVADLNGGMVAVDVSSLASPMQLSTLTFPDGAATDVALQGTDALVTRFGALGFTVEVVDLTNPAGPVADTGLGRVLRADSLEVETRDDVGFVAGRSSGGHPALAIFDNTNPTSVPSPPTIELDGDPLRGTGVAADSQLAFLTTEGESGLVDSRLFVARYVEDPSGDTAPPTLQIVEPANGSNVAAGSIVSFRVEGSDNEALLGIHMSPGTSGGYVDSTAPYTFVRQAPDTVGPFEVEFRAVDLASNTTTASVTVNVVASVETTVEGRVVDAAGLPQADAEVRVLGRFNAYSGVDGRFSIPGVPSNVGLLRARATMVDGMASIGVSESAIPAAGGITDVGDVVVTPQRPGPLFQGREDLLSGAFVTHAVRFDADGDLIDDVIAATTDGSIVTLLGQADGSFIVGPQFSGFGVSLTAGDINSDGNTDLITGRLDRMYSYLGAGDGSFAAASNLPVGSKPTVAELADFNEDGDLDYVAVADEDFTVSLALGNGDGTFVEHTKIGVGRRPVGMGVADLDGDGHLDIVTANRVSRDVSVLLGFGDGSFAPAADFDAGDLGEPVWMLVDDVNGDGNQDATILVERAVVLLPGDGAGAFGTPSTIVEFDAEQSASLGARMRLVDLDGDGARDLIVGNLDLEGSFGGIGIAEGLGGGAFGPLASQAGVARGLVLPADFDSDGAIDLLQFGATLLGSPLTFLQGAGTAAFDDSDYSLLVDSRPFEEREAPHFIEVADLDGDLDADVLTSAYDATQDVVRYAVLVGDDDGSFPQPEFIANGATFSADGSDAPPGGTTANVNGDGAIDLVLFTPDDGLEVLLGNGDGTFQTGIAVPIVGIPTAVRVGDFNGDGFQDLLLGVLGAEQAARSRIDVMLGNGTGAFSQGGTLDLGTNGLLTALEVGRLDSDAMDDFAYFVDFVDFGDLFGVLGTATGSVSGAPITLDDVPAFGRPFIGDFNDDGFSDVVALSPTLGSLRVVLGDGTGSFGAPIDSSIGMLEPALMGDFDVDGNLDVAGPLEIAFGNGDGTFDPIRARVDLDLTEPVANEGPNRDNLAAADLSGDGELDIVGAGPRSGLIWILLHQ